MASVLDPNGLESSFSHLRINKYYVLGYTVMLLYDHVLTLPSEIELIWNRRFTLPTYLFFIVRYTTPLVCILNLIAEHDPTWVGTRCSRWIWLPVAIGPMISAATGIILILRTHALYHRAPWILCVTVPIYLAQLAIMGWSIPAGVPAQFPSGFIGCIPSEKTGTNNRLSGSYIAALVFDASIFLLTFGRAVHLRILSARIPILVLIMRDGVIYFFTLFIVNLLNVFILSLAPPDLSAMNARFSNLITATLVARLMLNLRAATTQVQVHMHASGPNRRQSVSALENVGKWIVADGTIAESVFGMSEFDVPLGDGYEEVESAGERTGGSTTAVGQTNGHERGRELDIELRALEQGRPRSRLTPRENG